MRTRSSRSYALEPRDAYEIAGHGLLDTIEESFYLDDESDEEANANAEEQDVGGEDVSSGLRSYLWSEKESPSLESPPKRLLVKLRIPSTYASSLTSPGLGGDGRVGEGELDNARLQEGVSSDKPMLNNERPRLVVVLRMPRSAGQIESTDPEHAILKLDQQQVSDATREVIVGAVPEVPEGEGAVETKLEAEKGSEELAGEDQKERVEASAHVNSKMHKQTRLRDELFPIQIVKAGLERHARFEKDQNLDTCEPMKHHVEHEATHTPDGLPHHIGIPGPTREVPAAEAQLESEANIDAKIDEVSMGSILTPEAGAQGPVEAEPSLKKQIGVHNQPEVIDREDEVDPREDEVKIHKDLPPNTKDESRIERQPKDNSLEASEHDSSLGDSSTGSSLADDSAWPTKTTSEEPTASVVPTPLTMPSPDLHSPTPSPPPSPHTQSRKRSLPQNETGETERYGRKRQRVVQEYESAEVGITRQKEAKCEIVVAASPKAQQNQRRFPKPIIGIDERLHVPRSACEKAESAGNRCSQSHSIADDRDHRSHHHQQVRRPVQKPKRKPIAKSGRQRLLEQRMSSSSQRVRGGPKPHANARPAKRKRHGS